MKNIFKSKRNILIIMFALVILMGIGFAAYSQQLQIKDTSSIDSDWNVYIKDVAPGTEEEGTKVGGATGTGAVENKTTAKLNTDLKYPGDYIIYTITVANEGTVDAEIEKVELKATKKNTVIKYSIIEEANIQYLNVGDEKTFKVKIEYDPTKTETATEDQKSNTLTLTVDYVQKGTGSGTYVPGGNKDNFTGTVYSSNELICVTYSDCPIGDDTWARKNLIWPEDNINKIENYTEDYTSLNTNYFLKHIINNGAVESNELCFIKDGLHCIKPNDYEKSKTVLLSIFGENSCNIYDSSISCNIDDLSNVVVNANGDVESGDRYSRCYIYSSGAAYSSLNM